jgi:hypothetical protein
VAPTGLPLLVSLPLALAACTPDFRVVGDPAVAVDLNVATGGPRALIGASDAIVPAPLDTGSPLSVLGSDASCGPGAPVVVRSAAVPDRVRLIFPDLNPACAAEGGSILGGDLLARYEVVFPAQRSALCPTLLGCIQLFANEIQSTGDLGGEGYAVLPFRLLGGGSYADDRGRVLRYSASRVPLRVCVNPPALYDPTTAPDALGRDVTLLLATGVPPLTLGTAAADRVGLSPQPGGIPISLTLPGAADATTAIPIQPLARLALVGQTLTGDADPGPCAELQRARCLALPHSHTSCDELVLHGDPVDNDTDAEPFVILEGPLPLVNIPDETPYLQGARAEVRPRIADVDGTIGGGVLSRLDEMRIDYLGVTADDVDSGPRLIVRCPAPEPSCILQIRHPK